MIKNLFNTARLQRCRVGDRVMFVAGRADFLGRTGVIHCATVDSIEWARPDELAQVLRRDWVVELDGYPIRCERDGVLFETHAVSANDPHLMPLLYDKNLFESEEEASA